MASEPRCEECRRLTDLYLESVRHHARLMDGEDETLSAGDREWKLAQAERSVHDVRDKFLAHRAMHSSE
jgi:hypothetical protein